MKQSYLRFPNNEWGIVVCYDFDVEHEYEEMYEQLRSFGMSPYNIRKSLRILSNYNTGMAVSNDILRMSAIYISKATSMSEWWDSAQHELAHVVVAIIDHYDVPYYSEDAAYLTGFLTKQLVELVGEPCY